MVMIQSYGYGSRLNHHRTAGFSLCFHLPGFRFGYLFLTNTHIVTHDWALCSLRPGRIARPKHANRAARSMTDVHAFRKKQSLLSKHDTLLPFLVLAFCQDTFLSGSERETKRKPTI